MTSQFFWKLSFLNGKIAVSSMFLPAFTEDQKYFSFRNYLIFSKSFLWAKNLEFSFLHVIFSPFVFCEKSGFIVKPVWFFCHISDSIYYYWVIFRFSLTNRSMCLLLYESDLGHLGSNLVCTKHTQKTLEFFSRFLLSYRYLWMQVHNRGVESEIIYHIFYQLQYPTQ